MEKYHFNTPSRPTYDVYLSYSAKDTDFANSLCENLEKRGVRVFLAPRDILAGEKFAEAIVSVIKAVKWFVPIISNNSITSKYFAQEIALAYDEASDRSKNILSIRFSDCDLKKSPALMYYLLTTQCLFCEGATQDEAERLGKFLADRILGDKEKSELHERLSEYLKSGANGAATEVLCELSEKTFQKISENYKTDPNCANKSNFRKLISEFMSQVEKIINLYDYTYGEEGRALALKKRPVLAAVKELWNYALFSTNDLFFISCAIRLKYSEREILYDCIDGSHGGDLSNGLINVPIVEIKLFADAQQSFVERYEEELVLQSNENYSEDEWLFITETQKFIYRKRTASAQGKMFAPPKQETDRLLESVATFMREGNKIFDMIGEMSGAEEFLHCLILSYERLKAYCEVVGEKKVLSECVKRIFELKEKLKTENLEAKADPKIQDGIRSLLGLSIPKTGHFDVFISHKSEDADIASDMYDYLKANMKEPFYDKETLVQMSEAQYRKSIMRALDGSQHFVVILSDLSYIESYWVSLEMEIFMSEIDEGRKQNSNFLLVVTNKVYDEIMSSNKAVLPIEYRRCEIMKVSEYKSKLLSYLNKTTVNA